jgi:hypothetical protein
MISEIELTEALKELTVERLDIDLFGVAPVDVSKEDRRGDVLPIICPTPSPYWSAQSRYRMQLSTLQDTMRSRARLSDLTCGMAMS